MTDKVNVVGTIVSNVVPPLGVIKALGIRSVLDTMVTGIFRYIAIIAAVCYRCKL